MSPYVLAELCRRPWRTLAAALGLAVGVAVFLSLQAYGSGYRRAARGPLAEIGADIVAQRQGTRPQGFDGIVFPHSTAPVHPEEVAAVRNVPGVEGVAEALFLWSFEGDRFLVALGFDADQDLGPGRLRAGLRAGRFLKPNDTTATVVDTSFASEHRIGVGDGLPLGGRRYEVVGLVDTSRAGQVANANVYLSLAEARALAVAAPNVRAVHQIQPRDANVVFVRAEASKGPEVAEHIGAVLGRDAIVTTPRSFDAVLGSTLGLIDRFGALVGAVGIMIAGAGFLRAATAGLAERRRDVALLRAVGWRRWDVGVQLTAETVATGTVGAAVGIVLALGVAAVLSLTEVTIPVPWELSPTPHFLPGGARQLAVTVGLPARVTPGAVMASLALAFITTAAVSWWLTRQWTRIKPAEAWRGE